MPNQNSVKTHCNRGHELFGDNLRIKVDSHGNVRRECRICIRLQARKDAKGPRNKKVRGKELWDIVLANYGPICVCCGETERDFLTLDHINGHGEGYHHRKDKGCYGSGMYLDIIRQGFPRDKYRILCIQCNWVTRFGRKCPHEIEARDAMSLVGLC